MCADAPDMTAQIELAKGNVELGREAMAWWKTQAADAKPAMDRAANTAEEVSRAQLSSMRNQDRLATEYDSYRKNTFQPVEERLVGDAMTFNTDAERERLAGVAQADTASAFGGAREQLRRDTGRVGLDANDGAYRAGLASLAGQEALATATNRNKARSDARTVGRAMLMDSASLGRNLPSQQATAAQLALSAGNASSGNAQVPVTMANQYAQMGGQGYGAAINANNSAANIYGNVTRQQAAAGDDSALWGTVGKVAGTAMMMSSKDEKTDKKPASGRAALSMVRKVPVQKWRYKDDSPAADGGQQHTGPMAQDVNQHMGEQAAPGGTMIDPVTMNGVTLAAVQELDRKVSRLAKSRA